MSKKGAIEIQFNWIFVLIAGALVLLIITGFVFRWMKSAQDSVAAESLRNIDSIITATGTVEGETNLIDMPDMAMSYDCKHLGYKGLSLGSLQTGSLFSPGRLKGSKIIMWVDGLFLPFYTGNVMYLTSNAAKYIIVSNSTTRELNKTIAKAMNNHVNVQYIDESQYPLLLDENNYHTVVVFLSELKNPAPSFKEPVKAVKVRAYDNNISGELEFYTAPGIHWVPNGTSAWTGNEMLIGGIITGEHSLYECVHSNLMGRWGIVVALLKHKLKIFMAEYPSEVTYASFNDTLSDLYKSVETNSYSTREFMNKIARIERSNTILAYKGMPVVY